MIEFMVIGYPRSCTAWMSNWLTTDTTHCIHDPLFQYHYDELDGIESKKMLGISCTGIVMFKEWLVKHPARKLIIHRDINDVNESLRRIGLDAIPRFDIDYIDGIHIEHEQLFDNPKKIYEYLVQKDFDEERFIALKDLNIQRSLEAVTINPRILEELRNTHGICSNRG